MILISNNTGIQIRIYLDIYFDVVDSALGIVSPLQSFVYLEDILI